MTFRLGAVCAGAFCTGAAVCCGRLGRVMVITGDAAAAGAGLGAVTATGAATGAGWDTGAGAGMSADVGRGAGFGFCTG